MFALPSTSGRKGLRIQAAALDVDSTVAQGWIDAALAANEESFKLAFARKRGEINKRHYEKIGGSPVTEDLWSTLPLRERVRGKDLLSALREVVKIAAFDEKKLGRPTKDCMAAASLITLLESIT
jgi:hypothetical protein